MRTTQVSGYKEWGRKAALAVGQPTDRPPAPGNREEREKKCSLYLYCTIHLGKWTGGS